MKTVVGIFTSRVAAERAAEGLQACGIPIEQINCLTPGSSMADLDAVPTTDAEQPGVGPVLGGVVGGVAGASGGLWGAAVASTLVPGVGPVMAFGLAAAAILGLGGAVAGAAAGGALENTLATGLPKDELFVYEDALRQGRTVLLVLTDQEAQADRAHDMLAQVGAETIDAAREHWWLGMRDAEAESYTAQGGDFSQDEMLYRRGFEAALQPDTSGKPYDEVLDYLQIHYANVYREEAFRFGYARGRVYYMSLRENYRSS
jgi:hypothetical protein